MIPVYASVDAPLGQCEVTLSREQWHAEQSVVERLVEPRIRLRALSRT